MCHDCCNQKFKKYYKGNTEKVKTYIKKYNDLNDVKKAAHTILKNSVYKGDIVRPDQFEKCLVKTERIEGHHNDYTRPLEVKWLCTKCHNTFHKDMI